MSVIGVAGNSPIWRQMDTGEYLRRLDGQSGRKIFDEMRRSEPQIKSVLRALSLPIIGADYYVEPASDDAADVEIADFVRTNLFEGMTIGWKVVLRHVKLMDPFGFSPFEKVYQRRADGRVVLRKLDPRLPVSVVEWEFDQVKHSLTHMVQEDSDGKRYRIPIEKLVIFTRQKEGDNWEGVSELRAAYKPWKVKNDLEKLQAIAFERFAVGFPVGTHPVSVKEGSPEHDALVNLLLAIQANEESYGTLPEGFDVKLLTDGLKGMPDILTAIKYYDQSISRSVLAQWLDLGQTESGSRALGQSFIDVFLDSLQEDAEYICETLNRFVVRELVDYNWDVDEYPVLKVGNIKQIDTAVVASLKTAGIITADTDLENTVRKVLGLPEIDEETRAAARTLPIATPAEKTEDVEPEEEPEEPDDENELHEHNHRRGYLLADREPTTEERLVNLSEIEARLNGAESSVASEVLSIKADQQRSVVMQATGGKKVQNIVVPRKKDLHDLLVRAYRDNYKTGKAEAKAEIERQSKGASLADPMPVDDLFDLIEEEISLRVEGAASKLKTMVYEAYLELRKEGLIGDELRRRLEERLEDRVSDATWNLLASSVVNQGWGHGRRESLEAAGDGVDYWYRSAILDGNACGVCREKDGKRVEPTDADFVCPDPECDGGSSRCRCMVIAVMKSESAGE